MARPERTDFSAWLRGGQTIGHTLDMVREVISRLVLILLLWFVACVIGLNTHASAEEQTYGVLTLQAKLLAWLGAPFPQEMSVQSPGGLRQVFPVQSVPGVPWIQVYAGAYFHKATGAMMVWALGAAIVLVGSYYWYREFGREKLKTRQVRGQIVAPVGQLIREIEDFNAEQRKAKHRPHHVPARIVNVPYPFGTEVEHTLVVAAPGSGKTVALHTLIDSIRARGDRAVVYDPDLAFIRHHYNPETDVILNPFDDRGAAWSPFYDARESHEWAKLAESLFKDPKSGDPYWTNVTRQIFTWSCTTMSRRPGGVSLSEALDVLFGPTDRLRKTLTDTPAAEHLADGSPGRVSSLRSVLIEGIAPLIYLTGREGRFSIREWVNHPEKRPGFLFLSAPESHMASLRPLLGHWSEIVVSALLNRNALGVPAHPTWLILEEFPSLGRLDALADGPQRLRQYGGAVVVCMQQISQLQDIYGREKARTLVGQCATKLILRANDYETATYLSELLGRRVMHRVVENTSYGANTIRDGVGLAPREEMEAIWLPEDILNWPALQGAISVPNARQSAAFPVAPLKFQYQDREQVADGWAPLTGPDPVHAFLTRNQPRVIQAEEDAISAGAGGPELDESTAASDAETNAQHSELVAAEGETPTERDNQAAAREQREAEYQREQEQRHRAEDPNQARYVRSDRDTDTSDPGRNADMGRDGTLHEAAREDAKFDLGL
ncbi:type IV secretion system DNA-binding domain-containing protein [Caulobacter sp. 17J65-9]|uniref:type IV secretion system DNA-binding domain-containing protein n=1 Tax=Caulobacter sp. 17J65-9 TaxID=2709382 RepID=UPI0013C92658|nr:type IV secretion system DNA-binding domain-containing protein [Caulobacter sp. 17J65-9]NEX91185.1 type IV secretion system DNA-binding domain-containing protein [Caulobacter sp. 17J65-9]